MTKRATTCRALLAAAPAALLAPTLAPAALAAAETDPAVIALREWLRADAAFAATVDSLDPDAATAAGAAESEAMRRVIEAPADTLAGLAAKILAGANAFHVLAGDADPTDPAAYEETSNWSDARDRGLYVAMVLDVLRLTGLTREDLTGGAA